MLFSYNIPKMASVIQISTQINACKAIIKLFTHMRFGTLSINIQNSKPLKEIVSLIPCSIFQCKRTAFKECPALELPPCWITTVSFVGRTEFPRENILFDASKQILHRSNFLHIL